MTTRGDGDPAGINSLHGDGDGKKMPPARVDGDGDGELSDSLGRGRGLGKRSPAANSPLAVFISNLAGFMLQMVLSGFKLHYKPTLL